MARILCKNGAAVKALLLRFALQLDKDWLVAEIKNIVGTCMEPAHVLELEITEGGEGKSGPSWYLRHTSGTLKMRRILKAEDIKETGKW